MSAELMRVIEVHADYISGLSRTLLYMIAWRCPQDGQARTVGGQVLAGTEVFIPRSELEGSTGASSRAIAKACERLESAGLMVRKRYPTRNGGWTTAVSGRATVYVCPSATELDAARAQWKSSKRVNEGTPILDPVEDGHEGAKDEREDTHRVNEGTPPRVNEGTPPKNPKTSKSSIHSPVLRTAPGTSTPTQWTSPEFGTVRIDSGDVARPRSSNAYRQWQDAGEPVLVPPVDGSAA